MTAAPCFAGNALVKPAIDLDADALRERLHFGVLLRHVIALGEVAVRERGRDVVVNAHLRLQNVLERSARVAAGVERRGLRDAHDDAVDVGGADSFPLRERERDLRRRLREVAGRHGLEEHGEDLGAIREQLRHLRRPRPAERREHAGVAVERGARRVRAFGRELHGRHGAARGQAVMEEHLAPARARPFVVAGGHVRGERERIRRLLLVQAE